MGPIAPDLAWYTRVSRQRGVGPRCPFATVHRCPRYYQSLWLIGECTGATQIAPAEDAALRGKWERSDTWPVTGEQSTSVSGPPGDPKMFMNFCPEAAFDRFGWFATDLHHYTDEIDVGLAHARLGREGTHGEDWRWTWEMIHPMHYTECPLYSLLLPRQGSSGSPSEREEGAARKVLDLRPTLWGMSLNVNALLALIRAWWTRRRAGRKGDA